MKSRYAGFLIMLSLMPLMAVCIQAQTGGESRTILADRQPGADMGAKIAAADAALGSNPGQIQVGQSGAISSAIMLSQNHELSCMNRQVVLTMSSDKAMIRQQSHTRIQNCEFASQQTAPPAGGGGEIFAQNASDLAVRNVTFSGGGHHILYHDVSNFRIENTHHTSITALSGAAIVIQSSNHGQIVAPQIHDFVEPDGSSFIRLIGIVKSDAIEVSDPVIRNVDSSTAKGCAGVGFSGSGDSSVKGGAISGLHNCDGVLTESVDMIASVGITISGTSVTDMDTGPGAGSHAGNGEGFDIFHSKGIRLSDITARNNGKFEGNRMPGLEVSASIHVEITNCDCSDNGLEGIRIDGSLWVNVNQCRTNNNGGAGIIVEPMFGNVAATNGSPEIEWAPGRANQHFSAVWPSGTKIIIEHTVYSVGTLESKNKITLTSGFAQPSGTYAYDVDSYAEIEGGESSNNGQRGGGTGAREGVYFSSDNTSRQLLGQVRHLVARDTQSTKTQTYGIRVENSGHIVAEGNSIQGNLMGTIRDSPGRSTIR